MREQIFRRVVKIEGQKEVLNAIEAFVSDPDHEDIFKAKLCYIAKDLKVDENIDVDYESTGSFMDRIEAGEKIDGMKVDVVNEEYGLGVVDLSTIDQLDGLYLMGCFDMDSLGPDCNVVEVARKAVTFVIFSENDLYQKYRFLIDQMETYSWRYR